MDERTKVSSIPYFVVFAFAPGQKYKDSGFAVNVISTFPFLSALISLNVRSFSPYPASAAFTDENEVKTMATVVATAAIVNWGGTWSDFDC